MVANFCVPHLADHEQAVNPSEDIPPGPDFFRFSDDETFADLLRGAGLIDVTIDTLTFTHQVPSTDALSHGIVDGSVRTAALVRAQPHAVQEQIRAAVDEIAEDYRTDEGLELPISVKVGSGTKVAQARSGSDGKAGSR